MSKLEYAAELMPLEDLEPWEEVNVRRRQVTVGLDELAESIKRIGLLEPIVVQDKQNGKYKIIVGQRRFYAFKQLAADNPTKFGKIPAIVRHMDKLRAIIASMTENVQRRDIPARDKALACQTLLDELHTPEAVAEELGLTVQTVRKWLGYYVVPESIKKMVDENKISAPEAIQISSNVTDEQKAVEIAKTIVDKKMTKPQKERVMDELAVQPEAPVPRIFKAAEEKQRQKEFTFVLPDKYANGLEDAAKDENKEANQKAKDIVIDWIRANRYA